MAKKPPKNKGDIVEDRKAARRRFAAGRTLQELYNDYPSYPEKTIQLWIEDFKQVERGEAERGLTETVEIIQAETTHYIDGLESNEKSNARQAMEFAKQLNADLEYQVRTAVWMSNCRFKLAIESETVAGAHKINTVQLLPDNIDWDNKVVHFSGKEYGFDCLIPDTQSAKLGLELLMKLTGTDQVTTEEVKLESKLKAIEAEAERVNNKEIGEDSKVAIIMERPERKTLEQAMKEQNGVHENESSKDDS